MKKFWLFALALLLVGMVACEKDKPAVEEPTPAPDAATEAEVLLVGVPAPGMGPWSKATFTRESPGTYKVEAEGVSGGMPGTMYIRCADGWYVFTKDGMSPETWAIYTVSKTERICKPCFPRPPLPLPSGPVAADPVVSK